MGISELKWIDNVLGAECQRVGSVFAVLRTGFLLPNQFLINIFRVCILEGEKFYVSGPTGGGGVRITLVKISGFEVFKTIGIYINKLKYKILYYMR